MSSSGRGVLVLSFSSEAQDKSWLAKYWILLPHIPALSITSLMQTQNDRAQSGITRRSRVFATFKPPLLTNSTKNERETTVSLFLNFYSSPIYRSRGAPLVHFPFKNGGFLTVVECHRTTKKKSCLKTGKGRGDTAATEGKRKKKKQKASSMRQISSLLHEYCITRSGHELSAPSKDQWLIADPREAVISISFIRPKKSFPFFSSWSWL